MQTSTEADLWLYRWLAQFKQLNYRAKILLMAFVGIHVPLIALATWYALRHAPNWQTLWETLAVTLVATLAGTAVTLFVLNQLLRPVLLTSHALRLFRTQRERIPLPTGYTDEVGTLMADAQQTLQQLDQQLDALEFADETTGLPNRKRFTQQVEAHIAHGQAFAVAILRFSNFARIADTLDLQRAEDAARLIAQRLGASPTLALQLARIAPSKFACIMPVQTADAAALDAAAEQLRVALEACAEELHTPELIIQPVMHAGLSVYPADGADAASLIDSAVTAASQADTQAPIIRHSAQARQAAVERLKLEQDLRRALERNEFALHFQPVVDVLAGRTVGAEALLRWTHPQRGAVPPLAFIGAAEALGLIEPIGLWVLHQACTQVHHWNNQGLTGLRMAVNVSARQFQNPALTQHILEAVAQAGISPDQLEIELTETAAMADHGHTRRVFTTLRDAGVGIAIDDFGTGYASMSYLRKLPFDKLKIDREFVADVHRLRQSQAICGALIELSKGLDLRILAEGAEAEEDVRYLAERGCDLFQGYYFSRPVPAEAFVEAMVMPQAFSEAATAPALASA